MKIINKNLKGLIFYTIKISKKEKKSFRKTEIDSTNL